MSNIGLFMMRVIFVFILTMFCVMPFSGEEAHAKSRYITGSGHFISHDEDGLKFIKEQVLYNAFREVVSQELGKLGFDADNFWHNYDLKFEEYFQVVREKIEDNYLKGLKLTRDDLPTLDEIKKNELLKLLRKTRLNRRRKYRSLGKTIRKWMVTKSLKKSVNNPKYWSITLKALVNKRILYRIHKKIVGKSEDSEYKNLYLTTDFSLKNMDWGDFQVAAKTTFVDSINKSWLTWFKSNPIGNVEKVDLAGEELKSQLKKHISSPFDRLQGADAKIKNSLWLKINFDVEKLEENELLNSKKLSYAGGIILFDLKNNRIIFNRELKKSVETYNLTEIGNLKSIVMNHLYRAPLEIFADIRRPVSELSANMSIQKIDLDSFSNIMEVYHFIDLLRNRGVRYNISAALRSYHTKKVVLSVNYLASEEKFKKFLLSLKNKRLKTGNMIKFIDESNPYSITFEAVNRRAKMDRNKKTKNEL